MLTTGGDATVNAVSLKLKYASTAFLAVLLAAFAFVCLFAWQLHLHSQRVENLAQAAVHATASPGRRAGDHRHGGAHRLLDRTC